MMKVRVSLSLLLICGFVLHVTGLPLPSYMTACNRNDPELNDCILKNARNSIKKFVKGDLTNGSPRLDPLEIKEIKTAAFGSNSNNGIKIIFKDSIVKGMKNFDVHKINADVPKRKMKISGRGNITLDSKYDLKGRLLIFPLTGNGKSHIELYNVELVYTLNYDLIKKNGIDYPSLTKDDLKYEIGGTYIKLDNLFNGDKILGETTNRLLNENWKDVLAEIGPPVVDAIKKAFTKRTKIFMSQVSYDEFLTP